jgi:hypothetical protein
MPSVPGTAVRAWLVDHNTPALEIAELIAKVIKK